MSDAAPPPWVLALRKREDGVDAGLKVLLITCWGYGPYKRTGPAEARPGALIGHEPERQPARQVTLWACAQTLAEGSGTPLGTVKDQLRRAIAGGWILRGKGSLMTLAWRAPWCFEYGGRTTGRPDRPVDQPDDGPTCSTGGPTCPDDGPTPARTVGRPLTFQGTSNSTSNQLAAVGAREEPDPHGHTRADTHHGALDQRERSPSAVQRRGAPPSQGAAPCAVAATPGIPAHGEAVHARAPEPRGYGSGPGVTSGHPRAQPRRGGGDHPGSERRLAERNAQADLDEQARLARIEARRSGRGLSTQTDVVAFEQAVCEAAPSWSARMQNRPQWRQRMHEAREALKLTPEQGARVASKWERDAEGGISPGQPDLDELWSTYSTKRDWLREAAGLGESKPARKSGALPMEGGGGKTKPRRVRAFENKATYDARIAREAAAS